MDHEGDVPTTINGDSAPRTLTIMSPAAGEPMVYKFQTPNSELIDILRLAVDEFEGLKQVMASALSTADIYQAEFHTMEAICHKFNKAAATISNLWKGATKPGNEFASTKLLSRILTLSYNKAVDNEKALNKHYEAFSSETYGETSFMRMQMIIDEVKPTSQDVFVDLGSGVGQLVAHVAGGSKVKKAFGIEIAHLPAKFAAKLEEEFRRLMKFFGKKLRPFSLEKGNFLDEQYRSLITQDATIIFINNFAFKSDLEAKIKQLLLSELKSGTRIISTKPYGPLNKNSVTERQLNDIASILDVVELKRCPNPCSWTSADVPYYLHTVNHERLEKYFNSLKSIRCDSRRSGTPSSKNSDSRESSVCYKDRKRKNSVEEAVFGPTTRRKWQAYVSESNPQSKSSSQSRMFSSVSASESESDSDHKKKKKKPKTSNAQRKGRPRKSAEKSSTDFSVDAKEGIELMHQLTCAVSEGRNVDTTSTLSDLKSHAKKSTHSSTAKPKEKGDMVIPFPKLNSQKSPQDRIVPQMSASRYPNLEVFLAELRTIYEHFLDNMKEANIPKNTVEPRVPAEQQSALVNVMGKLERIKNKYVELGCEIESLRQEVAQLVSGDAALKPSSLDSIGDSPSISATTPFNNKLSAADVPLLSQTRTSTEPVQNGVSPFPKLIQQNSAVQAQEVAAEVMSNTLRNAQDSFGLHFLGQMNASARFPCPSHNNLLGGSVANSVSSALIAPTSSLSDSIQQLLVQSPNLPAMLENLQRLQPEFNRVVAVQPERSQHAVPSTSEPNGDVLRMSLKRHFEAQAVHNISPQLVDQPPHNLKKSC